jgi:ribonuclease P protein component
MPRRQPAVEAIARLVDSADFERLLRSPSQARTPHFAVHHLPSCPAGPVATARRPLDRELSTIESSVGERPVDDFPEKASVRRLGAVVPKRHARRSVTRSLLKRQVYAAAARHAVSLSGGLWMVRLRAPFDRVTFTSASSTALRLAARAELDSLFQTVVGAQAP